MYAKELKKNLKVCQGCGHHFAMTAFERIAVTLDEGLFFEYDAELVSGDPLHFPDYQSKLEKDMGKSGLSEAVVTGEGTIKGYPVVVAVMDSRFRMGSMGSVVGEKIARAIEQAIAKKYPFILFSASGGARMQEGVLSLMQMAKTSAALAKLSAEGGLYISIMTNPTTGGVSASFASLGDYNFAEPGALIGFAGRRIIEQTIRQKLPDDFQTAEFLLKNGQLDRVVPRKEMRELLAKIIDMHSVRRVRKLMAEDLPFEKPLLELNAKIAELRRFTEEKHIDFTDEIVKLEAKAKSLAQKIYANLTPWQRVQIARHAKRPTTLDLINELFTDFIELHGDRLYGDDGAIVAGIAKFNGQTVTVIGHQKGKDTKDNIARNFGMPHPEGYRKALRLMKQADKFKRPIICFINTPGAYPGKAAEERGQSEAIAKNLLEMSLFGVPIVMCSSRGRRQWRSACFRDRQSLINA